MRPKVRHVAVMTKNRDKMVEFYQKVFGLEPKHGFGGAIYMSDGDVNIALIEVKRDDQREGINHFGFEVNDLEEWIHEVDLVKTNHALVPRVFVDPTDLCSREPRPKGGRSGAPGGRNRLVHDDELGSEQRVHGSLSKKISVFETVGFPFRRRGFAQPRLIGGESGKIFVRRRPWHG